MAVIIYQDMNEFPYRMFSSDYFYVKTLPGSKSPAAARPGERSESSDPRSSAKHKDHKVKNQEFTTLNHERRKAVT